MNAQWTDAQNWLDLLDHIWIGLVLIAVAAVPSYFAARNHKGIKNISEQVVNGHPDPMRMDLDKVISKLDETSEKVNDIARDLTDLRVDLGQEEGRREVSDRELRDEFDKKFFDFFQRFIK